MVVSAVTAGLVIDGLTSDIAAALVVGWGVAAAARLAFGFPVGEPTPAEIRSGLRELGVAVAEHEPAVQERWGVTKLTARADDGTDLAVSAFGGFLVAQAAARRMLTVNQGTLLLTGASASVKGYAQSAPFAMGKFALRGLAQSMARELAPEGIHVAHVVIDGGIRSAARPVTAERPDSLLDPVAIARSPQPARLDSGVDPFDDLVREQGIGHRPRRKLAIGDTRSKNPGELAAAERSGTYHPNASRSRRNRLCLRPVDGSLRGNFQCQPAKLLE